MEDVKLLETVADIAYYAGYLNFSTGNSRADTMLFIKWAQEFNEKNKVKDQKEDYFDYILAVDEFAEQKIVSETKNQKL